MYNDLISIIVPVYNVQSYLERCILSLLQQTYSNIEILLIDDGSTDKSGDMCEKFSLYDSRIKTYHKKNGGLSDARNFGIKKANGEFYCFVDSDDFISENMIETLYNNLLITNADISICKYQVTSDNELNVPYTNNMKTYTKELAFQELLLGNNFSSEICNKMFKKDLFDNIQFPKSHIYEDMFTFYKTVEKSNIIVYSDYVGYGYFYRPNSISNSSFSLKKFDWIDACAELINYCNSKYPSYLPEAINTYIYANISIIKEELLSENHVEEVFEKIRSNIKKYQYQYLTYNKKTYYNKLRHKIQVFLLCNLKLLYVFLVKNSKKQGG